VEYAAARNAEGNAFGEYFFNGIVTGRLSQVQAHNSYHSASRERKNNVHVLNVILGFLIWCYDE
jgi:hypothetical protein